MGAPRLVLDALEKQYRKYKADAEAAVAQVRDEHLRIPLDANTNSLAVILRHMAGNLRSRFTDFLSSDGEKPWRDRDREFVDDAAGRAEVMADWERGWECLFAALRPLADADLALTVHIRGEPLAVADALTRSLAHAGYHTGQIVQLARFLAKDRWQMLSIPRGGSQEHNERMRGRFGAPRG